MIAGPFPLLPPSSARHFLPPGLCSLSSPSWGLEWSLACWKVAGSMLHCLSLASHPPLPTRAPEPLPTTNPRHLQPRPPHGLDHLSLLRHSLFGYPFAPLLLPLLRHLPQALPFPASSHPLVYIVKPGRCTQSHTRPDRGAHTFTHNRQRWQRQQLSDSSDGGSHRYAPPSGGGRRGQTGEFPHP